MKKFGKCGTSTPKWAAIVASLCHWSSCRRQPSRPVTFKLRIMLVDWFFKTYIYIWKTWKLKHFKKKYHIETSPRTWNPVAKMTTSALRHLPSALRNASARASTTRSVTCAVMFIRAQDENTPTNNIYTNSTFSRCSVVYQSEDWSNLYI